MGTFFRCGVDIFLMLSGALSLGRIWDIKSFLGKRLPRIVEPFLFWLFVIGIGVLLLNLLCPSFFDGFKNYIPIKIMTKFNPYLPILVITITIILILLAFKIFYSGLKKYSSSNLMIARI